MKLAAMVSGGKDSTLALHRVLQSGNNVKYLVAMIPEREDSWMFHYPNIRLTSLFAEAVGIPLVKKETSGIRDEELEDLKGLLATLDVDGIVSGAVFSEYQKSRVDRVCGELGIKSIAPLWHEDPVGLMEELIKLRFRAIITGVYAYGFDQAWLGRQIDRGALNDLIELSRKYQVSVIGEGGEYETLVLDAPCFRKRIRVVKAEPVWEEESGHLLVEEAVLEEKNIL